MADDTVCIEVTTEKNTGVSGLRHVEKQKRDMSRELVAVKKDPQNCDVSIECVRVKEEWDGNSMESAGGEKHDRNCNVSVECVRIKKEDGEHNVTREISVVEHDKDRSINVDCVHIKEEVWCVNDELACVKKPEWPNSMNNKLVCVKIEDECASECVEKWNGVSVEGVEMGLYLGHEVKRELVLGPEELQPQDIAFRLTDLYTVNLKEEQTHPTRNRCETLLRSQNYKEIGLRTCFVRLERIDNMLTFNQKLSIGIHKLNTHIKIERIKFEKEYSCDTCGEQFEVKTDLITHVKKHNLERDSECHTANESPLQTNKCNLKKKTYQPKKRLFICNYCNKEFWLRQAIATHLRTHTGEKPFKCQKCNKKFTDLSTLIRHKRVHTGEKPYSCDTCNKNFSEKYLLRNHKRTHTGEIRYSCKFCNKPFNHISNLARHERSHTEKPYVCDFCSKRFNTETRLNNHALTHMQVKPHKCGICEKSFKQSSHLHRHLRSHVGKPYLCEVCKARFSQISALRRHERREICQKRVMASTTLYEAT